VDVRGTPSCLTQTHLTHSPDWPWPTHTCWTGHQSPTHSTAPDPNQTQFVCSLNQPLISPLLNQFLIHTCCWLMQVRPLLTCTSCPTLRLSDPPTRPSDLWSFVLHAKPISYLTRLHLHTHFHMYFTSTSLQHIILVFYRYIELCLQWDPYPFLFGSPARYDTSVCTYSLIDLLWIPC
jgi:hypothetical protein